MKETAARVLVTWVVLLFLAVAVLCASPVRSTISTPEWQNNFSDLPKVVFLVVFSPHLTRICHFVFGRNVLFVAKTLRARQNFLDDIFVFKIHFCFRFPLSALDLCCNADWRFFVHQDSFKQFGSPALVSYIGGTGSDSIEGTTFDESGNVWFVGISDSTDGYLASAQNTLNGAAGSGGFLVKYNKQWQRQVCKPSEAIEKLRNLKPHRV
jgi:hypothetical protein